VPHVYKNSLYFEVCYGYEESLCIYFVIFIYTAEYKRKVLVIQWTKYLVDHWPFHTYTIPSSEEVLGMNSTAAVVNEGVGRETDGLDVGGEFPVQQ
jgi:hypothetical protein